MRFGYLSDNDTERHINISSFLVLEEEVLHMQQSIEVRFIDLGGLPEVLVDIIFLLQETIIVESRESFHDFFTFGLIPDFEYLQNNLGNTDDKIFASIFCEERFHESIKIRYKESLPHAVAVVKNLPFHISKI